MKRLDLLEMLDYMQDASDSAEVVRIATSK